MKVTPKDGRLYAEVTLRDVVEHTKDLSGLPMLAEVKRLYDENDKLRELASELLRLADSAYAPIDGADEWMDGIAAAVKCMLELGIEVPDV